MKILIYLTVFSSVWLVPTLELSARPATATEEAIHSNKLFEEKLVWLGKEPTEEESAQLLAGLQQAASGGTYSSLENYLSVRTNSPWAASLRANLAARYREAGLYSKALEHWDQAWPTVQNIADGEGKRLGDFILVHWTRLLSSLGRAEKLESIFTQTEGRTLEELDWQRELNRARNNASLMRRNPEISFRCGTLALLEVGRILGSTNRNLGLLPDLPSPATGFAMSELVDLSRQMNLDLVAVQRTSGEELIVPSIIHWKQNHYAAIVEKSGNRYRVIDPTFGRERFLPAAVINAEASGFFMVPKTNVLQGWAILDKPQVASIFGKGLDFFARSSTPPCPDEGQDPCDCPSNPPGSPGSPGSPGNPPGCRGRCSPPVIGPMLAGSPAAQDVGMPTWLISDPLISTWLFDTPMLYRSSKGTEIKFRLTYHSDEERPNDTNVFNFGPYWNCNWLSYVEIEDLDYFPQFGDTNANPFFPNFHARCFGAAGGQRQYNQYGDNYKTGTEFATTTNASGITSIKIHYPNGSVWNYGLRTPHPSTLGKRRFFLTNQVDGQGRTTTFNYSTNGWVLKLNTVVDLDGKTNVFNYTNTAWPTLVTSVQDPYGHEVRFAYETNRLLTNLVDAAGLASSFRYLYTGGMQILTNLTTPYGTTRFEYLNPFGIIYGYGSGGDYINRAVRVTEPDGAQHVFMFKDYTPTSAGRPNGPWFPCSYSDVPSIGQCDCGSLFSVGVNNHNMYLSQQSLLGAASCASVVHYGPDVADTSGLQSGPAPQLVSRERS